MVKIIKGEIRLSENEYNNLIRQEKDGKIEYIYKTTMRGISNDQLTAIDAEKVISLIKEGKTQKEIIKELNITSHFFRLFITKTFGATTFYEAKKKIIEQTN